MVNAPAQPKQNVRTFPAKNPGTRLDATADSRNTTRATAPFINSQSIIRSIITLEPRKDKEPQHEIDHSDQEYPSNQPADYLSYHIQINLL